LEIFELEECGGGVLSEFLRGVVRVVIEEEGYEGLALALRPLLSLIETDFSQASLINFPRRHFTTLAILIAIPHVPKVTIYHIYVLYHKNSQKVNKSQI
jgi:hypothetical protein